MRTLKRIRIINFVLVAAVFCTAAVAAPITLRVDASEAARKIYHAELTIPASPGPFTLFYPKWIPGEHAPTGPVTDLAGLKISAGGQPLEWKRDSVEMFAFRITVPPGASSISVKLDFLSTADASGFSSAASATSELAILSWNQMLLYPQGKASDDVEIEAELKLPPDWKFGTALDTMRIDGANNTVRFSPVSMTTLVDSPVLAGRHFRRIELTPGETPAHFLDIAADSEEALDVTPGLIAKYGQLVKEARALFGATHYTKYVFLLALSDQIAHFGLEHHESSDNQSGEHFLIDPVEHLVGATLLPHELVHSWNGKYRRPDGLATGDFEKPMRSDLLWVYEGLTEYLGWVLAARSGLVTQAQSREFLALEAANLDNRAGRLWRPLADTAVAAQLLYEARRDWDSMRRSVDFYDEGLLIWLEADTIIRRQSQGRKSIDDFCRTFYGAPGGPPQVKPYTFENLTEVLNSIAPYDWTGFFAARLNRTGTDRAPLGGIEGGGYRLAYADKPTEGQKAREQVSHDINEAFSIGLRLSEEGSVIDVLPQKAAGAAAIGPGMKIIAVNSRKYSADELREAIRTAKDGTPLELLIMNGKAISTYRVNYRDGAQYPTLEKNGQAALMDDILKPLR